MAYFSSDDHACSCARLKCDISCGTYAAYLATKVFAKQRSEKEMELKDTIELMTSADWKDRFKAEYLQTKIRYEKLHKLIVRREVGKCDFNTPIPLISWEAQAQHMGQYLFELEKQAVIHGIELPKV